MNVLDAMQKRRSVRKFTEEAVSNEETDILLHAAMSGPSACNRKPWEFYVITDPAILEQLRGASRYTGIRAPLAIVVCGARSRMLPLSLAPFWVQDCSAATENILLAAVDLGLGTVWCGIHPQKQSEHNVAKALSLPDTMTPLNIIWIGHPAEEPEARDQFDPDRVHIL